MTKQFEDEFMDIQIRMVSTCMEALEDSDQASPERMYIYAFDSSSQSFFNVFFVRKGMVLSFEELGVPDDIVEQVFDLGIDDVQELTELCDSREKKAPNQYKLVYDLINKKLDTEYGYDDLKKSNSSPIEEFLAWQESIEKSLKGRKV